MSGIAVRFRMTVWFPVTRNNIPPGSPAEWVLRVVPFPKSRRVIMSRSWLWCLSRIGLALVAAYGCADSPTEPRSPRNAAPPPGVALTVDEALVTIDGSAGVNFSSGVAVFSGTAVCGFGSVELTVTLSQSQKIRRVTTVVRASDAVTPIDDCTTKRFWSVALTPESGGFTPGEATASVKTSGQYIVPTETTALVKLYWARK